MKHLEAAKKFAASHVSPGVNLADEPGAHRINLAKMHALVSIAESLHFIRWTLENGTATINVNARMEEED